MTMPPNQAELQNAGTTASEPAELLGVDVVEAVPSRGIMPKLVNEDDASPSSSLCVQVDDTIEVVRRRDFDPAIADPIIVVMRRMLDTICHTDNEIGHTMANETDASRTFVQIDPIDSIFISNESGDYMDVEKNSAEATVHCEKSMARDGQIDLQMPIENVDSETELPEASLCVQVDDTIEVVRRRDFDPAIADPIIVVMQRMLDTVCQTDNQIGCSISNTDASRTIVQMDPMDSIFISNESGEYLDVEMKSAEVTVQDVVEKSMEKVITKDVELGPTSNPSSLTSEFVTPKLPRNFAAIPRIEDTATPMSSSSRSQDLTLSLRVKTTSSSPSSSHSTPETEMKFIACNTHAGLIQVGIPRDKEWDDVMNDTLKSSIDEILDEAKSELQDLYGTIVTRIVNERIHNRSVTVAIELEDETANDSRDTTMSGSYVIQIGNSPGTASSSQAVIAQCAIGNDPLPDAENSNQLEENDDTVMDEMVEEQALKSQSNLKRAFVDEKGESENEKVDEDGYEPAAKKPRWEDYEGGYEYEHVFMKRIGQHAVHAETILEVTENQTSNNSNDTYHSQSTEMIGAVGDFVESVNAKYETVGNIFCEPVNDVTLAEVGNSVADSVVDEECELSKESERDIELNLETVAMVPSGNYGLPLNLVQMMERNINPLSDIPSTSRASEPAPATIPTGSRSENFDGNITDSEPQIETSHDEPPKNGARWAETENSVNIEEEGSVQVDVEGCVVEDERIPMTVNNINEIPIEVATLMLKTV